MWPEHVQAWQLFSGLSTQWRMGFNGPTGLDYNVLHDDLRELDLTRERYRELKEEVRIIEIAALGEINRKEE